MDGRHPTVMLFIERLATAEKARTTVWWADVNREAYTAVQTGALLRPLWHMNHWQQRAIRLTNALTHSAHVPSRHHLTRNRSLSRHKSHTI